MQGNDVEAIEQVFAETAVADHVFEVEVGGGEDAHIGAASDRIADPLVFLVLDEAQQLGLQSQRKVADLVEKQRTAVRLVDPTQSTLAGAGERATAVAKQLAFHQLGSQRRAVDRDAGFLLALAPAVNRTGQFTFTRAGLAKDKNVGVGACDLPGRFQHDFHRRAVGIETVFRFADLAFQRFEPRGELAHFQLLGGGQAQLIRAARLDQIIGGAGLDGINGGVDRRMGGDDHYAHPRRLNAHLREDVETVVLAQAQIKEAQIEDLTLQQSIGLGRAIGGGYRIAFVFEAITKRTQDGGFIVHQQNAALLLSGRFHFSYAP